MSPLRIIGIGSPYGQDQAGCQAAEAMKDPAFLSRFPPGQVAIVISDRPGIALIEQMRGASHVILIDAAQFGANPGEIRRFDGSEIEEGIIPESSHGVGVGAALALGRVLDELPKTVSFYGIEIGELDPLSRPLSQAYELKEETLSALKAAIADEIVNYC